MKMLRGCQKKVYFMKNVGGAYFEEAYLILKKDFTETNGMLLNHDLATEADRIIREASNCFSRNKKKGLFFNRAIAFALGAASSSAIIGTIALIIGIS